MYKLFKPCSIAAALISLAIPAWGGSAPEDAPAKQKTVAPIIVIPRLSQAPSLENFLDMRPEGEVAASMAKVSGFIQRNPHNGQPASQKTEAYLGYDDKNFYAVFVCFDAPAKVRAHMSRREDVFDDDTVELILDTFHDRRRAYAFQTTPLGVQWDAIWTEAPHEDSTGNPVNFDPSFDTVWNSKGKLTSQGYVVWMAIPFKSLRFSPAHLQEWGVILYRGILRENEDDFWPAISSSMEGRLGQEATAKGLEGISPGRNMQFIPYGVLRSFRALDTRDAAHPFFSSKNLEGRIGLDAKFILHDKFVLDATANPDFSQVETDDPQITVNQRFEVFFPEKRPFFQENSDYFATPLNLFFTRRIGDPSYGIRLTGRSGPYSVGVLTADDRGFSQTLAPGTPGAGTRAFFTVGRVSRDLFGQSSVGLIYTDWEFPGGNAFNRIGGADSRLKFTHNWTGMFQIVESSTRNLDGSYQAGPAAKAEVSYTATHMDYDFTYKDVSPGFTTAAGFVNRVDIREVQNTWDYWFRPKSGPVVSWGPRIVTDQVWAHDGTRLDSVFSPMLAVFMKRQSYVYFYPYVPYHERLRPRDFPALLQNQDYAEHENRIYLGTSYFKKFTVQGYYQRGIAINFVPPAGQAPTLARSDSGSFMFSVRPLNALKIENTYLFQRLREQHSTAAIFNNHIVQSKWNWQFNRELSLRLILEYNATLANDPALAQQAHTSLQTTRQFNADFLITYLVHPGTAIYVGYNSDLQNLDRSLSSDPLIPSAIARTRNGYLNDSRQFFVKISYLFRY